MSLHGCPSEAQNLAGGLRDPSSGPRGAGAGAYDSLRALKALGYERYFHRGRSRRDALKRELNVTPESVLAKLAKGVNHTDIPRRPIPQLGWSMGLWSGGPDDECYSIDFHCGAYSDHV